MLKLYDFWESGNCYKVRLLLSLLGRDFECIPVDILKGETRTEDFLARSRIHRVPVLEFEDGRVLAESNAILFHLAEGSPYLPDDAWGRAQVLQWMGFEQYSHEPNIATVRFWHISGQLEANAALVPGKVEAGYDALAVMEAELEERPWFAGGQFTIADIALYAYTHVAGEGGFELDRFMALRAWLDRVRAQPGYVPLDAHRPSGTH